MATTTEEEEDTPNITSIVNHDNDNSNINKDNSLDIVTIENNNKNKDNELQAKKKLTFDQIIEKFYKHILSWDASDLTPKKKDLKPVKVSFDSDIDYISTFEPLLFEECRAQLERSIEEGEKDDTSEPCLSRVRYISEVNDFLIVGLVMGEGVNVFQFHDNDLIMISLHHPLIVFGMDENEEVTDDEDTAPTAAATHIKPTTTTATKKSTSSSVDDPNKTTEDVEKKKRKVIPPSKTPITEQNRTIHLIGTVEHLENGGIKAKFYIKGIKSERARQASLLLRYEIDWWTIKLCNLSTLQREFCALYQCTQSNFLKTLLMTDDSDQDGIVMKIPPLLHDQFSSTYNDSQLGALTSALEGKAITLIQGPPGTGKTHVILGLISVLLHSTIVPKNKNENTDRENRILDRELSIDEKRDIWNISQPWFNDNFVHIRDNYDLIDYDFEERDAKRKRDLWRKLRDTGSVKGGQSKRRILLCAPSNGAVDEIVSRLIRDGLLNAEGRKYNPNLVRVGPGSHNDVESVSLDYMVRCRQQLMNSNSAIPSSSASTAAATSGSSRSTQDSSSIRNLVLDEADIVATTLSFSGSTLLAKMAGGFDIVIIDEAAQAVETSTLIPIQHQCKKVVLVGDPKQLPATIISPLAIKHHYDQSLFQRLQEKNTPHMLTTQYRMHSRIRAFPSRHFYQDLLLDGPNIAGRATHYHSNPFFGPLVFYDLAWSTETKPGGGSVFNEYECKMAMYIYQLFVKVYPEEDFSGRIGIISPYRQQVLALREVFKNYPGISIDTVDGFQGREREIIIFSCVRAPIEQGSGIGFLSDVRRMNVALTRPRSSLLILGNSKALSINKDWSELILHTQEQKVFIPVGNEQPLESIIPTFTNPELFEELSEKGQAIILSKPRTEDEIAESNLLKQKQLSQKRKQKQQKQLNRQSKKPAANLNKKRKDNSNNNNETAEPIVNITEESSSNKRIKK